MRKRQHPVRVLLAVATLALPLAGTAQEPAGRLDLSVTEAQASELRRTDELVDALVRNDDLVLASRTPDRFLPDRVHEGFAQYHQGVRVLGGGVTRQLAGGLTVSIFGTFHEGIDVDTTPLVPADEVSALIARQVGAGPAAADPPALVILRTLLDTYVLAWRMPMADGRTHFLDAHDGRIVHDESNVFEQEASVGVGSGIRGQRKKLSTSGGGGQYRARDQLRPAETVTLDMRHDGARADFLIVRPEGAPWRSPEAPGWRASDVASDPDNDWDDTAVVDAHAYAGFTYDYLALEQGWNGMDGENGRLMSLVNLGPDYRNRAFFVAPPYGPEGTGVVAFGRWPDGMPLVSADIVAHEIMHGVTYHAVRARTGEGLGAAVWRFPGPSEFTLPGDFTPRCGETYVYPVHYQPPLAGREYRFACDEEGRLLLYAAQGLAINEAYSDIVGTAVEFSLHHPPVGPLRADYALGEDTGASVRRIDDPGLEPLESLFPFDLRFPDAYSGMVWFLLDIYEVDGRERVSFSDIGSVDGGRTLTWLPSFGYPGQHWNSTILSHAFYLAVEGGRNRTTGLTVQGVGGANRRDIEQAFFRAMTDLMPSEPHMGMAAGAILQSAADLFGVESANFQAIGQALVAVGLLLPAGGGGSGD